MFRKDALRPYFWMVVFYLSLAFLAVLYSAFVYWQLLPSLPGLRWLMVHLITLGVFTQFVFGALPSLDPGPEHAVLRAFKPLTWIFLNIGLIILITGLILIHFPLITTGGTLIFLAILMLMKQLVEPRQLANLQTAPSLRGALSTRLARLNSSPGLKFYLAALFFLLIGVLVGTGLWQGWSGPLHIAVPKEVHVHSNLWGFTSMIFAGLLIDLYPEFARRSLARPASILPIFWLMAIGNLGLVLGPWLDMDVFTVIGLGLHTIGTIWLLRDLFRPLLRRWRYWSPGFWHLVFSYVWILLAVVAAPLVVASTGAGAEVAGSGGPILIYGWMLQVGYALIPFIFNRGLAPGQPRRLGGDWFSLLAMNAGVILYWISIFLAVPADLLRGLAFILWALSLIPILYQLVNSLRYSHRRVQAARQASLEPDN